MSQPLIWVGHGTWFYGSEAVFYLGHPWPTTFTAMTVDRWRKINDDAETCQDLVARNPILKQFYGDNITDVNIMRGVRAAEMFITHRLIRSAQLFSVFNVSSEPLCFKCAPFHHSTKSGQTPTPLHIGIHISKTLIPVGKGLASVPATTPRATGTILTFLDVLFGRKSFLGNCSNKYSHQMIRFINL